MIRIRPSSLKRASLCPGSERLCEKARSVLVPTMRAMTETGTDAHEIVAVGLRYATQENGEPRPAILPLADVNEYLTKAIAMRWPKLSGWDRWAVAKCLMFAYEKIEEHGITPENILIEHRMDGAEFGMEKGGTADLVLVVPFKLLIVIDWKFGIIEQDPAETNDQLSGYAIMGARTFTADAVQVFIIQPKLERDRRETGARYDAATLKQTEAWVRAVCANAQAEDAPLVAGYEQCHYCDALLICQVAREFIMIAIEAVRIFGLPQDPHGWSELIGAVKLAERFVEEGKAAAKDHLEKGGRANNWKLRPGGSVSSIKQTLTAYRIARERGMEATFIAACSVKLGELKDALGPDTTNALFGALIETKDKGPSLVACKE